MSTLHVTSPTPDDVQDFPAEVDVLVVGGGIAGLTLALQLRQALTDATVLVVERATHPVPEAAHKVGESSVEVQAHYLRDVLGLQDHLDAEQLHKFGLRMFFSHSGNHDIARRVEYGQVAEAPLPSYQLDRGRLENALAKRAVAAGALFADGGRVEAIALGSDGDRHQIQIRASGQHHNVSARWVIDATGRAGLLKRQLGLARQIDHHANASWFRVAHPIDVDHWSEDPTWQARVPQGLRRLSTNHLMGPGYWVWLIPLASGSTSVGIVAEDSLHPHEGFNTLDKALGWLADREPQCAAAIAEHRGAVQDFRVMRDYAYGCTEVFSPDRWCLTGEAGVSIDPLYSSGGDLMAISNGLITDLVSDDLAGADISEKAIAHNQVYLVLADIWLVAYQGQYPIMGNAQVMVAKVVWDTIIYWAVPGLLAFHDKFKRLGDSPAALLNLYRTWTVHTRVQEFLREWHQVDNAEVGDVFADPYSLLDWIVDLHNGMAAQLTDDELDTTFTENVALLEQLAGQLVSTVIDRLIDAGPDEQTALQIGDWIADPLLGELRAAYLSSQQTRPIDDSWISLRADPRPESAAA